MPPEMKAGRPTPTSTETLLWNQRIAKEEYFNARQNPKFALRNAVQALDVPGNFKPGHVDPSKDQGHLTFDPAHVGWDASCEDAREFKRCLDNQSGGPRNRQPYPMTSAQDHGWLLAHAGEALDRVRKKKDRMGIGWECKHPKDYSISTALPPPVLAFGGAVGSAGAVGDGAKVAGLQAGVDDGCCGSRVSASAPSLPVAGSQLSTAAPVSVLSNSAPSQLSRAAPTDLSGVSSALSRATSLPVLNEHPADRLHRRERRLGSVLKESARYLNIGDRGQRHARPLGITDATQFEDDFCKAAGVPLYKTIGPFEPTLKMHNGTMAPKWR